MSQLTNSKTKRILLVDDDVIFISVVSGTLEELGYDVVTASNGKEAVDIFNASEGIDLILSDVKMPVMTGVELLKELRKKSNIPFILTTGFAEVLETYESANLGVSSFLAKPYTPAELSAAVIKALASEDTKDQMDDGDFARISVDDFISGKVLQYNIYIRLNKNRYVKIANVGIDLDIERVRTFKQRGVKYLYLKRIDFKEYLQTSISITKKISATSGIDPKSRQRFLRSTGALIVEKALIEDLDTETVMGAKEFFMSSLEVITDHDQLFNMLNILNEHSDHLYAHSVGVSIYSIMIAQEIGWRANPTIFRVGLAGLFHDIGLKEIDTKILNSPRSQLSREDRMHYETHPTRSVEILSSCPSIPEEVIQAVGQHHEDPNGFGYPRGLKGTDLSPLSRLLNVADCFCEYAIKNPNYQNGMTGAQAVDKMEQLRSETLDPMFFEVLKKIVRKSDGKK